MTVASALPTFGTYDYTALCGITAAWQHMRHQACDFARHMMQVALAQSGSASRTAPPTCCLSRPRSIGRGSCTSTTFATRSSTASIKADLHPAQLPTRYAAVYAFFLSTRPAATARLRNFIEKAAQATLVGDVFDDAAMGRAAELLRPRFELGSDHHD